MYFKGVDLLSDFDKYRLNALASIPFSKYSEIVWIYISIQLVHEREIDARKETYDRWFIRVFFAALNLQTVDAVLMYTLHVPPLSRRSRRFRVLDTYVSWPNDSTVPVRHHIVVAILQAVRARAITDTLLALLKLLEEAEIARYCYIGERS